MPTSETYDEWLGQEGSRRRGGQDNRPAWKRGGFASEAAYKAALKKNPEIEELLK